MPVDLVTSKKCILVKCSTMWTLQQWRSWIRWDLRDRKQRWLVGGRKSNVKYVSSLGAEFSDNCSILLYSRRAVSDPASSATRTTLMLLLTPNNNQNHQDHEKIRTARPWLYRGGYFSFKADFYNWAFLFTSYFEIYNLCTRLHRSNVGKLKTILE